ncbi:unnamed protein product [Ectocarpus sp. 4 AP-2014]
MGAEQECEGGTPAALDQRNPPAAEVPAGPEFPAAASEASVSSPPSVEEDDRATAGSADVSPSCAEEDGAADAADAADGADIAEAEAADAADAADGADKAEAEAADAADGADGADGAGTAEAEATASSPTPAEEEEKDGPTRPTGSGAAESPASSSPSTVKDAGPATADAEASSPPPSAEEDGPAPSAATKAAVSATPFEEEDGPVGAEAAASSPPPAEDGDAECIEYLYSGVGLPQLTFCVSRADQHAVELTTKLWADTVTLGTFDAPRKAADLYAPDGVLWGTEAFAFDDPLWEYASELVRNTPEQIYAYYDYFARLPELRLVEFTAAPARVRGDFASQSGTHTFSWRGAGGQEEYSVEVRARFSLTFRRDRCSCGGPSEWAIVEHCTFSMPTAAAAAAAAAAATPPSARVLKHVGSATDVVVKTVKAVAEASVQTAPSSPVEDDEVTPEASPAFVCVPPAMPDSSFGTGYTAATAAADEKTWKDLNNRVSNLLLEEERSLRAKQIADLQHHADQLVELQKRAVAAKARAAERAVERAAERKVRAKREMELVKRAEKAKALAAELTILLAVERAKREEMRKREEEREGGLVGSQCVAEQTVLLAVNKAKSGTRKTATRIIYPAAEKGAASKASTKTAVVATVTGEKVKQPAGLSKEASEATAALGKKRADAVRP